MGDNLTTVEPMINLLLAALLNLTPAVPPGECPTRNEARRLTTTYANRVLGKLPVTDARTCSQQLGWRFRVVRRNDCHLPRTLDRRLDRVNVTVYQGQVLYAYVG